MSVVGPTGAGQGAQLPAGTRADSPEHKAALGFERLFVEQLTEQLAKSVQRADDEQQSAATSAYRDMLPGVLADAVVAGGGLGLADGLVRKGPA